MRYLDTWTAFLLMLFALVGLCGLFASYATAIPIERALARSTALDAAASGVPTDPEAVQRLQAALGSAAPAVLEGGQPLPLRISAAREIILDEERHETASVAYRTRLMLGVVTVIAATLGAGIMALSRKAETQAITPPPP